LAGATYPFIFDVSFHDRNPAAHGDERSVGHGLPTVVQDANNPPNSLFPSFTTGMMAMSPAPGQVVGHREQRSFEDFPPGADQHLAIDTNGPVQVSIAQNSA
jgi:hypothetical protein